MNAYEWAAGSSGVLAALAAWGMAAFIYASAPSRTQNRLAALFLALVGFQAGATFGYWRHLNWPSAGFEAVGMVAAISQSIVYLALLGTLDTPLARPFSSPPSRAIILLLAAASVALWPLYHHWILGRDGSSVSGYYIVLFGHGVALLYGFLVALSAWRRAAPGSAARARGRAFAYAFGLRDLVFFVFITVVALHVLVLIPRGGGVPRTWFQVQDVAVPVSVILMVLLMGYGMAKAHLFEVDTRLRLGLRRGSVATAFVAVFFVASQLAESVTTEAFSLLGGAVASGLLLFALAPLQRAAERLSAAVVPDARPLADRSHEERVLLYREQVAIAWEDGQLGLKERRMLDVARARLRLAAEVAASLEQEIVAAVR